MIRFLSLELVICLAFLGLAPAQSQDDHSSPAAHVSFWEQRNEIENELAAKLKLFSAELQIPNEIAKKIHDQMIIARDPQRLYLYLPPENKVDQRRFLFLSAETENKLQIVLNKHATRLLKLAIDESKRPSGNPAWALQLIHETLRYAPDYQEARRILGHRLSQNETTWRVKPDRFQIKRATRDHRALGFPAKQYWTASTNHFSIISTADTNTTRELAVRLEKWHDVWKQVFFEYYNSGKNLNRWIDGSSNPIQSKRKFKVVFFADRNAYLDNLSDQIPGIEASTGYYSNEDRQIYFYASTDTNIQDTWKHELAHQLFQESQRSVASPFEDGFLWLGEGIAMYFESLLDQGDYITLGGFDSKRLQYARLRRLKEGFRFPLMELSQLGQSEFQSQTNLSKIYSQSAGFAHYLMSPTCNENQRSVLQLFKLIYKGRLRDNSFEKLFSRTLQQIESEFDEFLKLDENQIRFLSENPNRRELCLIGLRVTAELLKPLNKTKQWDWLDFSGGDVQGSSLAPLKECEHIDQIFLTSCRIDDECVKIISELPVEGIDLSGTKLNDLQLSKLATSKKIKTVNLRQTNVTQSGIENFRTVRPEIRIAVD